MLQRLGTLGGAAGRAAAAAVSVAACARRVLTLLCGKLQALMAANDKRRREASDVPPASLPNHGSSENYAEKRIHGDRFF